MDLFVGSRALALGATALLVLASCGSEARDPRPNIVLVVIDTLRRDRVGCYGAGRDTTPNLDRLAAEGTRFENAYSTAPWTCPSVASILTGQLPSSHGVVQPAARFPSEVETLAEMLGAAGYETAGVVSNMHLRKIFGFDQGFETWGQDQARGHEHVSTPAVTDEASGLVRELAASDRPFFLFALFFDPHYEYTPHPEFGFASDPGRITGNESIHELRDLAPTMTPSEVQYIRDVYDEEVRFTDEGLGRLLECLRATGEYDDTLIVVTADHGEELLERGWLGHWRSLYDELVRVPLVVRLPRAHAAPGTAQTPVVETPISHVSLVPTLRQVARLEPNLPRVAAPSLLPLLIRERPAAWPAVFCEVDFDPDKLKTDDKVDPDVLPESHKRALIADGLKLIHDDVTRKVELYDLAQDPGELHDLAEARPEDARRLLALLEEVHATTKHDALVGTRVELSQEELDVLGDLGYADPAPPDDAPPAEERDP
jgi:arylsulfatase A-like enzyme